jgi:hypothetical protein
MAPGHGLQRGARVAAAAASLAGEAPPVDR